MSETKVIEYQTTDDRGQPIGKKTVFEYSSEEELIAKFRAAHENAARYAERLKRKGKTSKQK